MYRHVVKDQFLELEDGTRLSTVIPWRFQEWLTSGLSFRYECQHGSVSVYRDNKEYWTASKKVGGELRRKRLGRAEDIHEGLLEATALVLCNNWAWGEYHNQLREKRKLKAPKLQEKITALENKIAEQKELIQNQKNKITELTIELAQCKHSDNENICQV